MNISIQDIKNEVSWDNINWRYHKNRIKKIQEKIFQAASKNKWKKVCKIQNDLVKSRSAILLAVKRITQKNRGKYTSGIDRKKYLSSTSRMQLVNQIMQVNLENYQPQPVLWKYIYEKNKKRRRIGILTIFDRVIQTMIKMAIEPEWETKFEPNSYGFRPGRCCQDAVRKIQESIVDKFGNLSSPWILDADIKGFFNYINHDIILEKITNFKPLISRWLKAGTNITNRVKISESGIPQGGIISPLLANIALNGMEQLFKQKLIKIKHPFSLVRKKFNEEFNLIRYADDCATRSSIIEYR